MADVEQLGEIATVGGEKLILTFHADGDELQIEIGNPDPSIDGTVTFQLDKSHRDALTELLEGLG